MRSANGVFASITMCLLGVAIILLFIDINTPSTDAIDKSIASNLNRMKHHTSNPAIANDESKVFGMRKNGKIWWVSYGASNDVEFGEAKITSTNKLQ